jgi:hypothetical protein
MVPFEPKRACGAEQTLCIHPVRLSMQVVCLFCAWIRGIARVLGA